ncbi:MAG: cytochrome c oxidase subunit II [Chloroflexi bacterium]|nr:cytochrome c oxidase subunit II [Chloroflexota bacterium]
MPIQPPWTTDPAGPVAREIAPLYWIMFAAAVIVLIVVDGGLIYAGIRFRERPGVPAKQFHGNNLLELAWTVIPTLMVVTFSVLSFQRLLVLNDVNTGAAMTITVIARQWQFSYRYPNEPRYKLADGSILTTATDLHIPANTKIKLDITSQDVIHAFYIPPLGGQKDAVPGRTTTLWIEADHPGTYKGQCAEFCGSGHADMLINVVAHPKDQYAAWVASAVKSANEAAAAGGPQVAAGRQLFLSLPCAGCHTIAGTSAQGKVGPELTHIASLDSIVGILKPVNAQNLHTWIKDPQKVKPGTIMPTLGLDDATIDKIVTYLLTLK